MYIFSPVGPVQPILHQKGAHDVSDLEPGCLLQGQGCQRSMCEIIVWSILSLSLSYLLLDHTSPRDCFYSRGFECLLNNIKIKVKALTFFTSPFHILVVSC